MTTPAIPSTAVCRWCRNPMPGSGFIPGGVCPANTRGCSQHCGFSCGCDPSGWEYGPHEICVMGYSISHIEGHAVFLLVDADRKRAVEWCFDGLQPVEVLHSATPLAAGDEPMGCTHIAGVCFSRTTPLRPALATLYHRAGDTFDADAHEQVHAAMWVRWALS